MSMEFEGQGSDVVSHIINTIIRTTMGKDPAKFRVYLGHKEYRALYGMDMPTCYKVGFSAVTDPWNEPRKLLGVRIYIVQEDNHFKIYED